MRSVFRLAPGAVTVTWSGDVVPTNFVGLEISMAGPAIRPAAMKTPPAASASTTISPRMKRIC